MAIFFSRARRPISTAQGIRKSRQSKPTLCSMLIRLRMTSIFTISPLEEKPLNSNAQRQPAHDFDQIRRRDQAAGHAFGSDRKSTRLNSSHTVISYAVFCLKKKKKKT